MTHDLLLPRPRHRCFAAFYDRIAGSDARRIGPIRNFVAANASGRVLEIGCGTGLNLPHYDWGRVEALVSTEPDRFMLAKAVARAPRAIPDEARSRVVFLEVPAEALPFPDDSFDSVVSTLVLCTVTDLGRSLSETYRVLKPGGSLRLFEHVQAEGPAATAQKVVQPVYGWLSAGCDLRRDTEAAVRAAGFQLTVTERTSLGFLWPAFVGVATRPP